MAKKANQHYGDFTGFNNQGDEPDCMLATLANLADVSIDFARGYYLAKTGKTWTQMVKRTFGIYDFDMAVIMVAKDFGLDWFAKDFAKHPCRKIKDTLAAKPAREYEGTPCPKGEGAIRIKVYDDRHIVTFKNGYIYDSNMDHRETWEQWLRRMGLHSGNVKIEHIFKKTQDQNGRTVYTLDGYEIVATNRHGQTLYQRLRGAKGTKYIIVSEGNEKVEGVWNDNGRLRPCKPVKGTWNWVDPKNAR